MLILAVMPVVFLFHLFTKTVTDHFSHFQRTEKKKAKSLWNFGRDGASVKVFKRVLGNVAQKGSGC